MSLTIIHNLAIITARDLNEAWWLCIRAVLQHGREYVIDSGSYAGQKRKELDFVVVEIEKPSTRPLIPTVPEGLPSPTSMEYVENDYLSYLMTSAKKEGELYTYGEDIEPQYAKAVEILRTGNTNQACISVGNKNSIFLEHSQCLRVIDMRTMNNKLHYYIYFRSWDLLAGFPSNLAGIQLMKELMAWELGIQDGQLIAVSKGLHLYDYSWTLGQAISGLPESCYNL